eukprot:3176025-Prorocentrum_lima.AAC.1
MTSSLVGSEMCIRDRKRSGNHPKRLPAILILGTNKLIPKSTMAGNQKPVSYTHLTLPTICSV